VIPALCNVACVQKSWPALAKRSTRDQVIWLQQHLAAGDPSVKIDGRFSSATSNALKAFQRAKGLPGTGETDAATWTAVLAQPLRLVRWAAR